MPPPSDGCPAGRRHPKKSLGYCSLIFSPFQSIFQKQYSTKERRTKSLTSVGRARTHIPDLKPQLCIFYFFFVVWGEDRSRRSPATCRLLNCNCSVLASWFFFLSLIDKCIGASSVSTRKINARQKNVFLVCLNETTKLPMFFDTNIFLQMLQNFFSVFFWPNS